MKQEHEMDEYLSKIIDQNIKKRTVHTLTRISGTWRDDGTHYTIDMDTTTIWTKAIDRFRCVETTKVELVTSGFGSGTYYLHPRYSSTSFVPFATMPIVLIRDLFDVDPFLVDLVGRRDFEFEFDPEQKTGAQRQEISFKQHMTLGESEKITETGILRVSKQQYEVQSTVHHEGEVKISRKAIW